MDTNDDEGAGAELAPLVKEWADMTYAEQRDFAQGIIFAAVLSVPTILILMVVGAMRYFTVAR